MQIEQAGQGPDRHLVLNDEHDARLTQLIIREIGSHSSEESLEVVAVIVPSF